MTDLRGAGHPFGQLKWYRVESETFTLEQANLVLSSSDLGLGSEVSADAERFLTALPLNDEAEIRIDVVLNWFQELKERVPVP